MASLAGCGKQATPEDATGRPFTVEKAYAVGTDVPAGVYTAHADCGAVASSSADYDPDSGTSDDAILRGSARVGDLARIVVNKGEYLFVYDCTSWEREDGTRAPTPDPATRKGACTILRGNDDLVGQAVAALENTTTADASETRATIQDKLMAVVSSQTPKIWKQAGELVDYLDAPSYFVGPDGKVDGDVRATVAKIDALCGS